MDDKDIEHPPNKVMILHGKMQDKLDVLNNKMEMAGRDKALTLETKADLIQNLESITALVNLMQQKKTTVAPIFRKTTAAPTTTVAPSSTTAVPRTTTASTGTTPAGSVTTTASSKISDPMQQVMAMIQQIQQKINNL